MSKSGQCTNYDGRPTGRGGRAILIANLVLQRWLKKVPKAVPESHRYSMRRISFLNWLEHRLEEIPDTTTLAMVIARSGAAGVSRYDLRRLIRISSDALENLLAALVAGGQVTVVSVGGRIVYWAAG
jgi:hypothetical protein